MHNYYGGIFEISKIIQHQNSLATVFCYFSSTACPVCLKVPNAPPGGKNSKPVYLIYTKQNAWYYAELCFFVFAECNCESHQQCKKKIHSFKISISKTIFFPWNWLVGSRTILKYSIFEFSTVTFNIIDPVT